MFFDIESTGLGSGAGNTIFLLGTAQLNGQSLVVRQYFLPDPSQEVAFYHRFLNDSRRLDHLVTYNGKAFDWPQVQTRHTFVREQVGALPQYGHFDLFHAARRLLKPSLSSLKLKEIEQKVLGVERLEDIPGFLAPMMYFRFLKEQDPSLIMGVFHHNEIDLLTLVTLYIHFSRMVTDPSFALPAAERFEVARWWDDLRQIQEAERHYLTLLSAPPLYRRRAKEALARLYKKQKRYHDASRILEEILQKEKTWDGSCEIELAKIYEHHLRHIPRALKYAKAAYDREKCSLRMTGKEQQERLLAVQKRIARLKKKAGKDFH